MELSLSLYTVFNDLLSAAASAATRAVNCCILIHASTMIHHKQFELSELSEQLEMPRQPDLEHALPMTFALVAQILTRHLLLGLAKGEALVG